MAKRQKIKKVFNLFIYWLLYFILIILAIYSYSLVDLNLTFFKSQFWEDFRNAVIQLGYFKRNYSTIIYLLLISFLTFFNLVFLKIKINPIKVALTTGIVCLFAYPFLSHDFFNYLFDAKILTFYHKNPYLYKALDFPKDPWLRFMHWTHRAYPYGPTWLILTIIPSFLSFGKFILNFFFFKFLFFSFYLGSVHILSKFDQQKALFFATNPLVIIEGLISPHNDLAALFLGLVFLLTISPMEQMARVEGIPTARNEVSTGGRETRDRIWGANYNSCFLTFVFKWMAFLFSALIKYTTLPLILMFLPINKKWQIRLSSSLTAGVLLYLILGNGLYPWYFLNLLVFLPFINKKYFALLSFFSLILLFTYTPFILFGQWNKQTIMMRNYIFIIGSSTILISYFLTHFVISHPRS